MNREAEYAREHENGSAQTIQSAWRGYRVRSNIKSIHFIFQFLILYFISLDLYIELLHLFKHGGEYIKLKHYFEKNLKYNDKLK